jgi:DNA-binding response OmpR family regulator
MKSRILIAEDHPELRRLLALTLYLDGHEVVEVADGGQLLETLATTLIDGGAPRFDLVICEQRLPGILGMTILSGLRARNNETRFVLICQDDATRARARRLGGVVLDQPYDVDAIRGAVRAATM